MKKLLIMVAVLAVTISANAQEFNPFRVDGGVGYGIPFNDGYKGGVIFYAEPKYEIIPQLQVGIRWEGQLFGGDAEGINIQMSSGYLATCDYFLNNNKFRPFAGAGLGAFTSGGLEVKIGDQTIEGNSSTNFAAMARVGFDISHFRLTASYNIAFAKEEAFHFVGITAGFYIGGGKR